MRDDGMKKHDKVEHNPDCTHLFAQCGHCRRCRTCEFHRPECPDYPKPPIRIGFDIGGVLSKFPGEFRALMATLHASPAWEVYVVTDMPHDVAQGMLNSNGVRDFKALLCANWEAHGDMCKSVLLEEHGITMMIDDRPDYVTEGVPIGLVVSPRPKVPYYAESWKK